MVGAPVVHHVVGRAEGAALHPVAPGGKPGAGPGVVGAAHQLLGHLVGQIDGPALGDLENGAQAVTWLTEAQYEGRMPCAMLLGEELEDMPVLNLAAHVRQLAGREFPIILVSEGDWVKLEYRATHAGINAFVPCPLFCLGHWPS